MAVIYAGLSYGLIVVPVYGVGAPRAQMTVFGLDPVANVVTIRRTCNGETWTVPGWKNRVIFDSDTGTDFVVPLGREVVYVLFVNDQAVSSITITVLSPNGYIMDPIHPEYSLAVSTVFLGPNVLALSNKALKTVTYAGSTEGERPLGSRYKIARSGQREGATGVEVVINAHSNNASDELLELIQDTPTLLFRSVPSWGSIPALMYLNGSVTEEPVTRAHGGSFTQWTISGDLVAPVTRPAITGIVTHDMVKLSVGLLTHDEIYNVSGSKTWTEIKAAPLELGSSS